MILYALACAAPAPVDTSSDFAVVALAPGPDEPMVTQAVIPELTFSEAADPVACGAESVALVALTRDATSGDHTVDFEVPLTYSWLADDDLQLLHSGLLPRGWVYAVTVAGGPEGCIAATGAPMTGFYGSFVIP